MLIFASFAALILLLIFFGLKVQNLQKQLQLCQNSLKATSRRISDANGSMVVLSQQIQSFLAERLDASHKRGLVNAKHYETLQPMFEKISAVAVYCMEKGMSVEEALNAALQDGEVTLEQLREVIKVQPSDIRMAWSKNTLDGFIIACRGLSFPPTKTENSKAE
ncbi:MAG: hypothetical protein CBB67_016660 [Alteromonadaceae bacterium TMED7]|uniref:Uncharacterized protein n=1 Tax=Alteromonas alba TaxID=2079529 RepID=A0A2S9VAU6_9ALTE|nr:hypothetical protein [Alteromonas alba]MAJ69220.1 hypothetical protein [Alteromonadaceae bacterium]PRO73601.1 hypothetical protein C6Y40_10645 [Alteromonas alba]RPH15889.1 MAG: hypothetical protein CBB67_016660 [Alteromonadaceae bacterium TMED7]|tara:strand:+ start:9735 stop:10226 length:492 start_codon:yes stop_codon:yes gene_type:complete